MLLSIYLTTIINSQSGEAVVTHSKYIDSYVNIKMRRSFNGYIDVSRFFSISLFFHSIYKHFKLLLFFSLSLSFFNQFAHDWFTVYLFFSIHYTNTARIQFYPVCYGAGVYPFWLQYIGILLIRIGSH